MIKALLSALGVLLIAFPVWSESPVRPGDRVALVGNTFADQLRIHGYLETLLLQRSMDHPISLRNLGWGGDMLTARDRPTNFPEEEATLRAHQTDVIIACFGMGESFAGESGIERFKQDLRDFITSHRGKKYNGKTEVRLILISPISYEQLGFTTPHHARRNRELAAYTQAMREIADMEELPFVDLNEPTSRWMADPEAPNLTSNGVHLNPYGYWCVSRKLADTLLPGESPWRLEVDAKSGQANGTGVRILGFLSSKQGLAFQVQELVWPSSGAPVKGVVHRDLETTLDMLRVTNLQPGTHRLEIDGEPMMEARHDEWSDGVLLHDTPAHRALQAYREAVNDKNLQFLYGWKALNQVHIVGERRSSASGRALPAEQKAFDQLAQEIENTLSKGIDLKLRTWRIVPVKEFR